ncbi:MAG TPA: hypothetical protein VKG01_05880 [Thermoanaerobaculia bacterium]|nr:hypothetical protein [Thermoanaerobaculia bacterium]
MKPAAIAAFLLATSAAAAGAAAPTFKSDPCSLLTGKEVESVQKEKVASAKASEPSRDRFAVSQCFYTLPTFSKSVSLEVTRHRPGASDSPRDQWKQMFARAMEKASEREQEEEREAGEATQRARETAAKPRPVSGLGDEAYWVGTSLGGGLYVLKGDAYVRLSVGGPDPENVKVEKLTKLARPLLRRL